MEMKIEKLLLVILIAAVTFTAQPLMANNNNDETRQSKRPDPDCLELCVRPMIEGAHQSGVTITLYCGNEVVERIDSTEKTRVFFTLKRDRYYTVEVSMNGYVSRLVGVSTAIPHNVALKPIFRFECDVELPRAMAGVDDFYLDFPAGLVSFDKRDEAFEHSRKYMGWIKRELNKIKAESSLTSRE